MPKGVKAVWDLDKAYHETTPSRERVSINGLWRWQPTDPKLAQVPDDRWGYFKVPGCWPGTTDYMQKDSQTVHRHPGWQDENLATVAAAWYQRKITIPASWTGRRIALTIETLNSYAAVYVDGKRVGEIRYPAGELSLTAACRPGKTHVLSPLVVAMPLRGVMLSYNDSNSAREIKGSVARRGLCGDVSLLATPVGDAVGKRYLEHAGNTPDAYQGGALSPSQVLIVGRGGGQALADHAPAITQWLQAGGHLLALELDAREANRFLPRPIRTQQQEHIAAYFKSPGADSLFAGVGPADVHNRDPRELPIVTGGARIVAGGVLAQATGTNAVFCQLTPYSFIPSPVKNLSNPPGFLADPQLGSFPWPT